MSLKKREQSINASKLSDAIVVEACQETHQVKIYRVKQKRRQLSLQEWEARTLVETLTHQLQSW